MSQLPDNLRRLADEADAAFNDGTLTIEMTASGTLREAADTLEAQTREIERAKAVAEETGIEGHREPCYYCSKECNALHGNPFLWPIPLAHPDEPGKVKWHHIGCVSERLAKLDAQEKELARLREIEHGR